MIRQRGFILLTVTMMLWVSAYLFASVLDVFILDAQVSEKHFKNIQNVYRAEREILDIRREIELGHAPVAAQLIKVDACGNRDYQIQSHDSEIQVGYRFFNAKSRPGCVANQGPVERLWWVDRAPVTYTDATIFFDKPH